MSVLDLFRRKALTSSPEVVNAISERQTNLIPTLGGSNVSLSRINSAYSRAQAASYGFMYANQPAVRTVVDKIAENVSQLGLKLYERVSDLERQSANDHPAAESMRHPNDTTPPDQFVFNLVCDYLVYDNAYGLKFRTDRPGLPITTIQIPPWRVAVLGNGLVVNGYRIFRTDGSFFDVPPEDMMHWARYNPEDPRMGISRLETLRLVLAEDAASQAATTEMSRNGLRGGHIQRPTTAPEWSEPARQRFQEGWRNQKKKSPSETPVLEEDMKFINDAISPSDAEMLKGREFTLQTVARLYGVPVGIFFEPRQIEQDRLAFIADTIAPVSTKLAGQLNHSILLDEYSETDFYFEFELNEKLRGDPTTRFAAITAATGAPWLARNEARAAENKPPVPGGDELITPMNVIVGSNPKPAPNVMGPQDPNKPAQDGSHRDPFGALPEASGPMETKATYLIPRRVGLANRRSEDAGEFESILRRHFSRQQKVLSSKQLDAKAATDERWNAELAADLFKASKATVTREGGIAAARMAGEFDPGQTVNYLAAKARDSAEGINQKTAADITDLGASDAFAAAKDVRAVEGGMTMATGLFAWSTKEAISQTGQTNRMVSVSGGECEICAEFQGEWKASELSAFPPYHSSCNCLAEAN